MLRHASYIKSYVLTRYDIVLCKLQDSVPYTQLPSIAYFQTDKLYPIIYKTTYNIFQTFNATIKPLIRRLEMFRLRVLGERRPRPLRRLRRRLLAAKVTFPASRDREAPHLDGSFGLFSAFLASSPDLFSVWYVVLVRGERSEECKGVVWVW